MTEKEKKVLEDLYNSLKRKSLMFGKIVMNDVEFSFYNGELVGFDGRITEERITNNKK